MTLTELSYHSRRLLPFAILFCLIFLIIFYSFKLLFIYLESNQPKTIVTNPVFGRISEPAIEHSTSSAGLKFFLDTVEGRPVTASNTANVYFLPEALTRFGYREKIYLMAKSFGFDTEKVKHQLNGKTAVFNDGQKKLTIDISNFNFKFDYQVNDSLFLSPGLKIPSKKEIENKAVDFLKKVGRYPDELAKGTNNIIYLRYDKSRSDYLNVDKISEAHLVEIDFYRPNINDVSVVTPKFFNSQNYLIMLFEGGSYRVLKGQLAFFEKSEEQVGIYPLKSGETVWQELLGGQGKVVAGTQGSTDLVIKKMFLGYYDPDIYQSYLQPVYVFLGESDFVAYVPAVVDEYLIK